MDDNKDVSWADETRKIVRSLVRQRQRSLLSAVSGKDEERDEKKCLELSGYVLRILADELVRLNREIEVEERDSIDAAEFRRLRALYSLEEE